MKKLDPVIEPFSIHSKEFKKKSKQLIELNDLCIKFLYLHTFNDIEEEKKRIRKIFDTK